MLNALESEIRSRLAEAVSRASGFAFGAQDVHLPARHAAASLRPPNGAPTFPPESVSAKLFGAEMVESCRMVNGWLLLDLSAAFYDALTAHVNAVFPPPLSDGGRHAVNRMLVLARHGGKGCPQIPAVQRALLLCVCAGQNRASLEQAERAVGAMFRSIPPKDRTALLAESGALGSACARLLLFAAADGLPQPPVK